MEKEQYFTNDIQSRQPDKPQNKTHQVSGCVQPPCTQCSARLRFPQHVLASVLLASAGLRPHTATRNRPSFWNVRALFRQ